MNSSNLPCPACGSHNVRISKETQQFMMPFASPILFEANNYHCQDCDTSGDFSNSDDKVVTELLDVARKASVVRMIGHLTDEKGLSMAYIERALELPARTMMRWKSGDVSSGALALMRIIATYPFTIEVADAQFESAYATQRLAKEAINAVGKVAQMHNIATSIRVSDESPSNVQWLVSFTPRVSTNSSDLSRESGAVLPGKQLALGTA